MGIGFFNAEGIDKPVELANSLHPRIHEPNARLVLASLVIRMDIGNPFLFATVQGERQVDSRKSRCAVEI